MLSKSFIDAHDAVFVVTAPRYYQRQRNVVEQLGEGNFEFVYGVNKDDVSLEELIASGAYDETRARELARSGKPMSLGQVCCSVGHNRVYQTMVERGTARALIFEDDVYITISDDKEISLVLADLPDGAEYIYWDWAGDEYRPWFAAIKERLYIIEHRLGVLNWNPTMVGNMYPRDVNRSFMLAGRHHYANAYSLTLSGARKLLEFNTPIALVADDAVRYLRMNGRFNAYLSKTRFFGQHSQGETRAMESLLSDRGN